MLVIFGYPVLQSDETTVYLVASYNLLWKGYLVQFPSILVIFGRLEPVSSWTVSLSIFYKKVYLVQFSSVLVSFGRLEPVLVWTISIVHSSKEGLPGQFQSILVNFGRLELVSAWTLLLSIFYGRDACAVYIITSQSRSSVPVSSCIVSSFTFHIRCYVPANFPSILLIFDYLGQCQKIPC